MLLKGRCHLVHDPAIGGFDTERTGVLMSVQGLGGRLSDLAGAMRIYRRRPAVGDSRERLVALQRQRLVDVVRHAAGA